MKNAKELLEEFTTTSFRDPKQAAEMFTEDGAFEMPYLKSFGFPGRYEGREAIAGFFRFVRELYPDMDLENIEVMINTPEQAFAEYEFTAPSSQTGRTIHHLFFGRLVAEHGQIKLLRESINLVELALGVFPHGLADDKVPSAHKASRQGTGRVLFHEALAPSATHGHSSWFRVRRKEPSESRHFTNVQPLRRVLAEAVAT